MLNLDVYLRGERIGTLSRTAAGGCEFAYSPEALSWADDGAALLSQSLPVRREPYGPTEAGPYFEGLLPRGARRERIAAQLGLHPEDTFGLLAELGRDCPGAVVLMPEGEPIVVPDTDSLAWITDSELEELLRPEPPELFDDEEERRMRQTLPGFEHKLALFYDEDRDRWAWPEPGVPSTHVLKPEPSDRPGLAANEAAYTSAYRDVGLPTAQAEVTDVAGQRCLVSKRFDRWSEGPEIERLHQEGFGQALGLEPTVHPTLEDSCQLLRDVGEEGGVETLMISSLCDRIVGNCNPPGASGALLYVGSSTVLAPLQGIASTEVYGDTYPVPPAKVIPPFPPAPFLRDLAAAIHECGWEFQGGILRAASLMQAVCAAVGAAAERATFEGWYSRAIDEALGIALKRVGGFWDEANYMRPPGTEPLRGPDPEPS